MSQSDVSSYTRLLRSLMQQAGVSSFKALGRTAQVSQWQIQQLRRGQAHRLRLGPLLQISRALQVPPMELVAQFAQGLDGESLSSASRQPTAAVAPEPLPQGLNLQPEYQRLQAQMQQQRTDLEQELQQQVLLQLESWLVQWPTAAYAAQQNPQVPAVRLLPLLKPVESMLQGWGVEAIAPVGIELPYDPQLHQLMDGTAQPGDTVRVRYTGYRQGERLLHRAKVSPVLA